MEKNITQKILLKQREFLYLLLFISGCLIPKLKDQSRSVKKQQRLERRVMTVEVPIG